MIHDWIGLVGYAFLWSWVMSPWLRFALLPGLMPTRSVPWWDGPPFGYRAWAQHVVSASADDYTTSGGAA